jgi:hypothetical protein
MESMRVAQVDSGGHRRDPPNVVSDRDAEARGYLRIVDESGEDYGYAADRFFAIDLPEPLEKALLRAAS